MKAERRRNVLARACAWCGRVYTGSGGWQPERRSLRLAATDSICPTCAVDYRGGIAASRESDED